MKSIKFYAIIASIVFTTVSCVENSSKYKKVIAQRDSVMLAKQSIDSSYSQTLGILNDIEGQFAQINEDESQLKINLKGVEGSNASKRELIAAQMQAIKERMDQNKANIAELKKQLAKKGKANSQLAETIKRLQGELDEKTVQIQSLQAELEQKNIKINELNTTVDVQNKNIAEQKNVLEQQKSTIKAQEADLNTVWYCVATSKKLKDAKIISSAGLFQGKKVMATEFDKTAFTQVDLRNISTIDTKSKKIKIITFHPQNSYKLVMDAANEITISITDPSKFWSVSKYLVVQI